jgi:predicted AAA+ superfamily ATPase
MIKRDFSITLRSYLKTFPAILVTGARQVGKTTILKNILSKTHKYVLLEDLDTRDLAINDPRTFFKKYSPPIIIDEFQYAPGLVNYLQGLIDNKRDKSGQIILTGSQNFQMMMQITQSLAGRIGILPLYGLSSLEILNLPNHPFKDNLSSKESIAKLILRGTYPELWKNDQIKTRDWMNSYVQTFLERDLRQLAQVGDLSSFERFLKVVATRTGQVLNVSDVANDCGISQPTAQKWLSILERAYIIKLVDPFLNNLTSRVKKAKKIYFLDTGLASFLMGFRDWTSILQSPQIGALFETLVYSDFIKRTANEGEIPEHYYLQTKSKVGVDFILQKNLKLNLYEIKFTKTYQNKLLDQLLLTSTQFKNINSLNLLMPTQESYETKISGQNIYIQNWNEMA